MSDTVTLLYIVLFCKGLVLPHNISIYMPFTRTNHGYLDMKWVNVKVNFRLMYHEGRFSGIRTK